MEGLCKDLKAMQELSFSQQFGLGFQLDFRDRNKVKRCS